MPSAQPSLSICIPTWNGAATVERTAASLLAQQDIDFELVVCDDASSDDTVDRIRSLGDPRISVHRFDERAGIVGNWNRCLERARGPYVVLVGQDDEVDPRWARTLADALDAHPDAGLAFCRRRFEYDSAESEARVGEFFSKQYPAMLDAFYARIDERIPSDVMCREAMQHAFEVNLIGEPAFSMFRRQHPATQGGYDASMSQMMDWEFQTRFFASGPIVHCPEVLGTYHIRAAGVSVDNAQDLSRHYREYAHLLQLVLERFARWLSEADEERLREQWRVQQQRLVDGHSNL